MKINILFSQVEGPAVAALTQTLADVLAAMALVGTEVELSFHCEVSSKENTFKSSTCEPDIYGLDDDELPTELVHPLDYAAAQEGILEAVLPDDDPDEWSQENL